MPKIIITDECPEYIYKYCNSNVYEKFISNGIFRFGTLSSYRDDYEKFGSGYGDKCEGNETLFIRGPTRVLDIEVEEHGAVVIDQFVDAHIFSSALTYSESDHRIWYGRKDCNYDLCLKIRAYDFFHEIAFKLKFKPISNLSFMLARPKYTEGRVNFSEGRIKLGDKYLYKSPKLKWENEYRLVCANLKEPYQRLRPYNVSSFRALRSIEEIIKISRV